MAEGKGVNMSDKDYIKELENRVIQLESEVSLLKGQLPTEANLERVPVRDTVSTHTIVRPGKDPKEEFDRFVEGQRDK